MVQVKKNQGAALLTALFIMTLVAIVATAMSSRVQLDINRTRLIINHDKLYLASQAVNFWALSELQNEKNHFSKILKQGTVANYPENMANIQSQMKISGGLYDMHALFNLNNVFDRSGIAVFINIIKQAIPQTNTAESTNLALALMDWLAPYDPSHGKDVYTSWYLGQKPPYYPGRQPMQSRSEFRLVKNVSAPLYFSLQAFVTVLPEPTLININTASKEMLMSLGTGLTEQKINPLLAARNTKEIVKLSDINELLVAINFPLEQITTESQYFLNIAHVSNDDMNLNVYTLLQRKRDKNKQLSVHIVRESINGF